MKTAFGTNAQPRIFRYGSLRGLGTSPTRKMPMRPDKLHRHFCLCIYKGPARKIAYFLYPNIEYALATGMSFLCTDTKGDLFRNYAGIAKECYGYRIAVLDLRNPTRSDGNNLLHLINKYMDIYRPIPKICRPRPRRRSTPRSCPRPSSTPPGTAPSTDRTPTFTTRPRAC